MSYKEGVVVRYQEKLLEQAIVLKAAQATSALRASLLLLDGGFIYELGILKRTMDECHEDLWFLSDAKLAGVVTKRHEEYLEWFFHDFILEPDKQKPPEVPRRHVAAHNAQTQYAGPDPSTAIHTARKIMEVFSAYVHGSAVALMELADGAPPQLQVAGLPNTPRQVEHGEELWNHFYRASQAVAMACRALDDEPGFQALYQHVQGMASDGGKDYFP